jgi:hypothetical protein
MIQLFFMNPERVIFAPAEKRQIGPKNPWVFRSLLLFAVLLVAGLAQMITPGGILH